MTRQYQIAGSDINLTSNYQRLDFYFSKVRFIDLFIHVFSTILLS